MSNIYDSLEEKLYRANFSSEHSRQQAYLAVHATLFKNKQTPRIYVPDKPLDEKSFENILAHLLLCDIDNLIEDTNKYLTKLGTSTKTLLSLNNADKEELVELIEDLLLNGWGQGKILYDHLRVVPNEDCELLNFIDSQPISTGDKYHKILNKKAGFTNKIFVEPNAKVEYYIYYKFSLFDTNKVGRYEGEFTLISDDGTLVLPIKDNLYINIVENFIRV